MVVAIPLPARLCFDVQFLRRRAWLLSHAPRSWSCTNAKPPDGFPRVLSLDVDHGYERERWASHPCNRSYGYSNRFSRSTRMPACSRARHRRVGAPRRVGHFPSNGKASDRRPRTTTSSWETRPLFPRRHVSVTAGGGMGTRKKSQPSYSPSRVVPRGCPVAPSFRRRRRLRGSGLSLINLREFKCNRNCLDPAPRHQPSPSAPQRRSARH